jgi:hypothetical protein
MGNDACQRDEMAAKRLLIRYLTALDHGDIDAVEAVVAAASEDSELDRLIAEANLALHDEAGLSPLAEDAHRVRTLLRQTIPSAFIEEDESIPITVGTVAARLRQDPRLSPADRELSRRLVTDDRPVPPAIDRHTLGRLAAAIGDGSDSFWRRFRDAAIMAWLGHGHHRTQLAATRVAKARATGAALPSPQRRGTSRSEPLPSTPAEAARLTYAAAGRDLNQSDITVAPLDDLIAAFPLRIEELAGLTYRTAAEFLAKETGQLISVPERQTGALAGFLFCMIQDDALLGCILINRDDRIERRRFSAAHELGHYVQHFLPLLARSSSQTGVTLFWEGLTYPDDDEAPMGTIEGAQTLPAIGPESVLLGGDWRESEANQFAAEVLMPATACRATVERHRHRFGKGVAIRLLASEFLVSREAMNRRLAALGLLDTVATSAKGGAS